MKPYRPFFALATCLSLGCAVTAGRIQPDTTTVWVRSHNKRAVDVYLLCGSIDAVRLGTVEEKGFGGFEIPAERLECVHGLNFFLVPRNFGRGYWVGPVRPRPDEAIQLVIERYAGLSSAQGMYDRR